MTTAAGERDERGTNRPVFRADWDDVAFVHYAAEPGLLQPLVPFELDLFQGRAYVSLVAFTQRRLRPTFGGRMAALLSTPLASHPFLNVRTYVRHRGEPGIYFLCEWIPNRFATMIGPPLYGLPYRVGRLAYRYERARNSSRHQISSRGGRLDFSVTPEAQAAFGNVEAGSRDAFLLERYTAFTRCGKQRMCFRVRHEPWPQKRACVTMGRTDLLEQLGLPFGANAPVAANVSPGVKDVGLGAPIRFRTAMKGADGDPCRAVATAIAWLPLIALLALALLVGRSLAGWLWMWCIALAIFAGFKWLTWWQERLRRVAPARRSMAYLFAWVGMDAGGFLDLSRVVERPPGKDWASAVARVAVGVLLLWVVCPRVSPAHRLLLGWVGMLGMVLVLHFGTFDLLSLVWRSVGVDATPLMRQPARATSLADFWGKRWNTAFHQLTQRYVFRPLSKLAGIRAAVIWSFLLSGLIHDLVISVPARAGFGLPTAYFTIQGGGVLLEKSAFGKRLGLGRGMKGRAWAILMTAAPAWILFHPPFVTRVILPFLHAIGAAPTR